MSAADSPAPSKPRARLGRYELLGEIASGGMATVFLARAVGVSGFSRLVAIKKLHTHLEGDDEFVTMFLDEARLAAKIRHPNVVPTLDVVAEDGFYIVMEYIEGDRLAELLRHSMRARQRIAPAIGLKIAVDALEGLHAAHELRDDDGRLLHLIHRDVSPQNVMVGIDGIAKIVDFGIAKAESRLSQTREGQLKGKLSYMAPEQVTQRDRIDRRVDVFAMGIITWETLCSRRLFKGESDVETLGAVLNEPIPSPRTVLPDLPPSIEAVVMRALSRDPDQRFATAAEFAAEIERASHSIGGLAASRTVAAFVQSIAGPKLEKERWRLRSEPGASAAGSVRSSVNEEISRSDVHEVKALPRARAASTSPDDPGATVPEIRSPPRTPIDGSSEATATPAMADATIRSEPAEEPPRQRGLLWALIAVGALSLIAAVALVATRSSRTNATQSASPAAPSSASAATPVSPSSVPAAATNDPNAAALPAPGAAVSPAIPTSDASAAATTPSTATTNVDASTVASADPTETRAPATTRRPVRRSGRGGAHGVREEFIGQNPYRQ